MNIMAMSMSLEDFLRVSELRNNGWTVEPVKGKVQASKVFRGVGKRRLKSRHIRDLKKLCDHLDYTFERKEKS